jgi:hypothetical protein
MMMPSIAAHDGRSWAVFLSRAAALKALVTVALFAAFAVIMSGAGSAPLEQAELIGASGNPAAYRIFAALDALVWLGFGAVLLGFAALGASTAHVRAACLAALATTMVVGMVGGYLRLSATTLLATRYAAAGADEQASILESYTGLFATIGAHFGLGQVLYGIAFLLIASITISTPTFPRYLAYLIGLLGAYSLANQLSVVFLGAFLWAPLFFLFLLFTVVMDVGVAGTFWRRTSLAGAGSQKPPSA